MAKFYSARSKTIPPLPWLTFALTFSPGVVLGLPKSIDGVKMLKMGNEDRTPTDEIVEACTRGDWGQRLSAFSQNFGELVSFRNAHSDLEFIRTVRNEVGHAFGRDIDQARRHGQVKKIQIRTLNHQRLRNLQRHLRNIVRDIDSFLLKNHIGEYEVIDFFSKQPKEYKRYELHQRTALFKKAIGHYGAGPRGKVFCSGLIRYWDAL